MTTSEQMGHLMKTGNQDLKTEVKKDDTRRSLHLINNIDLSGFKQPFLTKETHPAILIDTPRIRREQMKSQYSNSTQALLYKTNI